MEIPGGFGFWQDDMTGLDRLNEELAEAKETLSQETELIRLRNELKEKQTKIEQRTMVYDNIAKHIQPQSRAISKLAENARLSKDEGEKKRSCYKIALLGSFIKRYANLMLLSYESGSIETGELGLSFFEVLRYLNFSGVPGEFVNTSSGEVSSDAALKVFEIFGRLLESDLDSLKGVFVNLSSGESVVCKLTLENFSTGLDDEMKAELLSAGISAEAVEEDGVTYIAFTLPSKGVSA